MKTINPTRVHECKIFKKTDASHAFFGQTGQQFTDCVYFADQDQDEMEDFIDSLKKDEGFHSAKTKTRDAVKNEKDEYFLLRELDEISLFNDIYTNTAGDIRYPHSSGETCYDGLSEFLDEKPGTIIKANIERLPMNVSNRYNYKGHLFPKMWL